MITIKDKGKYKVARCTTTKKEQCVVVIADAHCGAPTFNEEVFKNVVKYAVDNDALVMLLGDLIENATRTSVGSAVYEQLMPAKDQIDKIVELLKPIPSKNYIGGVTSNHEDRTMKASGVDLMKIICEKLDCPYFDKELFAIITKERESAYTIYGTHSQLTSSTIGGEYNTIENKWFKMIDADIVCKAHSHSLGLSSAYQSLCIDSSNVNVSMKERWIMLAGNYLERQNSYAASIPVAPKPIGTVAMWLDMRSGHKDVKGIFVK